MSASNPFKITVYMPVAAAWQQQVMQGLLPLLEQAVRAVAQQTRIVWMEEVQKAKLWSGEKDAYAQSITWAMTGTYSAVVRASYSKADEIEKGRPPRDLKRMLNTSLKVRLSSKGRRYLIIPFRHNTPGHGAHAKAMPDDVYQVAKQLKPSRITGKTKRLSGTGAYDMKSRKPLTVSQNVYQWGERLDKSFGKHYAGMVRFDTGAGKSKSSAYLTFRVMAEGSKGWVIPAQPGQPIVKTVVDKMQPLAEKAFKEAMKRSV